MYKVGDKVEYCGVVSTIVTINEAQRVMGVVYKEEQEGGAVVGFDSVKPYRTAHDKLLAMGLRLKITKNYADGVFSHEWWNENDDRVIVFYIDEKVTTVYEGSNEIMDIIPQYLEELVEKK